MAAGAVRDGEINKLRQKEPLAPSPLVFLISLYSTGGGTGGTGTPTPSSMLSEISLLEAALCMHRGL